MSSQTPTQTQPADTQAASRTGRMPRLAPSGTSGSSSEPIEPVQRLRQRRLIGVCAWALFLALAGFVLGAIAMIRLMGPTPVWFEPTFSAVGVLGLFMAIAAFVTVQFRRLPWQLLGASTLTLVAGIVLLTMI
ncbi:MAG TPA: hypothetical protein H9902_00530 [Candidatus Stackebrandtia faecavium]|nr:hypothetical protein [Candidatus Stackebrandtia faecavium]